MPDSQNFSPNSHREPRQRDYKSYLGFAVNKFFELVHTEIATFLQFLRNHTASHSLK